MMEWIISNLGTIGTFIGALTASGFIFTKVGKHKAEVDVIKIEQENERTSNDEWRKLYDDRCKANDDLTRRFSELNTQYFELQKEKNKLELNYQYCSFWKCEVRGCPNRRPPQYELEDNDEHEKCCNCNNCNNCEKCEKK